MFGFLTEAFFLCLRTAAEKNSFEDQVCKLPMDSEKFAIFNCDLKFIFVSFCLGTSLRTILPV